jgi:cold shock protein
MLTGTVKWFNESKGFGFITPADGSQDVFAHFFVIEGEGFRTLSEGQTVQYEMQNSAKGPQATRVTTTV